MRFNFFHRDTFIAYSSLFLDNTLSFLQPNLSAEALVCSRESRPTGSSRRKIILPSFASVLLWSLISSEIRLIVPRISSRSTSVGGIHRLLLTFIDSAFEVHRLSQLMSLAFLTFKVYPRIARSKNHVVLHFCREI